MSTSPSDHPDRYQLFEAARRRVGWTIDQLWISYLALGGTLVLFDLDGYLAGLMPLPAGQQEVLACALNERSADLGHSDRIPHRTVHALSGPMAAALEDLLGLLHLTDEPEAPDRS
jgi:hypothetical protein